jgi:molybdate transport system ATP-binding protein
VAVGAARVVALAPAGPATDVLVCIRGEDVLLVRSDVSGSARNHLPAVVTGVVVEGALARVTLDAGFPLTALVTRPAVTELELTAGARVLAWVKAPAVHLIVRS